MKGNELKLILADIDGTLVDEPRNMMPLTREVLNYLHREKGILFGIASGRPSDELPGTVAGYGLDFEPDFLIGMNGGEISDLLSGEEEVCYPLQTQVIEEIMTLMKDFDFANPIIYRDHKLVCSWIDDLILSSCAHAHKRSEVVSSPNEYWTKPTGKIMFRTPTAELCMQLEEYAAAHPSLQYVAFRTQPTLLEFQDPRANKGTALHAVSEKHQIPVSAIAAFGDASNDNEMLQEAGLGVCMINGLPDTKESADEITEYDNNQDGMVRYLLQKFPELFDRFDREIPDPEKNHAECEAWS